uniref:PH domain-containing protein n=1 Tax=Kalanchoe fedtschenkoi TaxID=63787 RepID=A0A7N0VMH0_KALFE
MLEDQVAYFLQKYLGNYVRGLNKEALSISVWRGDVELTNMQLKPEALNALNLPVKVKAGFLGSVKLKVPWSRLGQDPVLVSLDRIFLLAEPATEVEGCSEDALQEAKRSRVREMETALLEKTRELQSEMNKSWLGSLIDTVIGNLKLSISNIHVRYEDSESNPGHSFAAGLNLEKLSAITVDDYGNEIFATGGALERIQKSVELEQLSLYLDSEISPWYVNKPWELLLPSEWAQVFKFGTKDGKPDSVLKEHTYILQPVSGNAKYSKQRQNASINSIQPLQKAVVNLDDVTLCLSKDGYENILKLADNFATFNQRLKYAHFRPPVSVKSNPSLWWQYAYQAISDQTKKESGKLSWDQVLKYAKLRKKYISLYASLLKSDLSRAIVDDNKEIEDMDRELDMEVILQWRMLAHKFVEQSLGSEMYTRQQKEKKSWWSFGWGGQSAKDESEPVQFSTEDWERLNRIIGYKEDDELGVVTLGKRDALNTSLDILMRRNATKLLLGANDCLAELSCENIDCSVRLYPETKVIDVKLGSYKLSSPNGLLAESASASDSLVGIFCYKPFDVKVDWSLIAKASPCYVTYLKDSVDGIVRFFESHVPVSQAIALEAAAAVQMTLDGVKRTAQQQVDRALKDHARFLLDLDIAAPKITIPTNFCPDNVHATKLMLDLGNLVIRTQDDSTKVPEESDIYLQFDLVLSDVSAFLIDGDFHWRQNQPSHPKTSSVVGLLPVIDKCGIIVKLQQIRLENPSFPSTRLAMRLPALRFHFSPARYHRLMQVAKIFQDSDRQEDSFHAPWYQADLEGWLSLLHRKGVGNREAVWQRRYFCLVGPFLYVLESPTSKSYKHYISLRGKQICQVPAESVGGVENILALCEAGRSSSKVVEDASALILRFDTDESRKIWRGRLQGAIYRASGSVSIHDLSKTYSDVEDPESYPADDKGLFDSAMIEKVFVTGVLDELKISFNYNLENDQKKFTNMLLSKESSLFEFRAIGGQVEVLMRGQDMLIGTVLKTLEIEDLVCCNAASQPCYVARSYFGNVYRQSVDDIENGTQDCKDSTVEGDDEFFEAPEDLVDFIEPWKSSMKVPSFDRVVGLLPDDRIKSDGNESLNSFVKAQIVIYDQSSHSYNNIDTQVIVTLATLSFYCRRPTILGVMDFVNAINIEDEQYDSFSDNSILNISKDDVSKEGSIDQASLVTEEPSLRGFLGKGKSRVVFNLRLYMERAQIVLMNENETQLATLSQDNLLTDIKVFPSSFSIKAALGNLRISDDSLPESHAYFWACDMRNPGGKSFVELIFTSFNDGDCDYNGYEYSLLGQISEVRVVYLNRFIQEVISYFMGLVPYNSISIIKFKDQVTNTEKWFTSSEIEGSPAVKLDISLRKPIIVMPRQTNSSDYLKLDIVHITINNTCKWFYGGKNDMKAVHVDILSIMVIFFSLSFRILA